MSRNRIAIIKLARGEVGFFDDLTRIHLTLSRPSAEVYDNMNTAKLRRGVSGRVIELVAGSLIPTSKTEREVEEIEVEEVEELHVEHSEAVETIETVVETVTCEPEVKEEKEDKPKKPRAAKKKVKDEE